MSKIASLKDRIAKYEAEIKNIGHRLNVNPVATVEFPQYRVLPDEVLLALKIIERHQYKIMLSYKEIENAN